MWIAWLSRSHISTATAINIGQSLERLIDEEVAENAIDSSERWVAWMSVSQTDYWPIGLNRCRFSNHFSENPTA